MSVWAEASTLSGIVTRSDTGLAVDSATVLVRGTTLHVLTNSQGVYSIPAIPAGAYGISCSAPGLVGRSTGTVDLSQDATQDFNLTLPAAETVSVSGTTTCNGTPCAGILVQAMNANQVASLAVSASSGTFSISNLPAGTYDFRALAIGFHSASSPAIAVDITAPPSVQLALTSAGPFTLTGHVRLDDNPLDRSGSTVRVFGTTPLVSTSSIASGEYELASVPAGPISIAASHTDYNWHHRLDLIVQGNSSVDFLLRKDDGGTTTQTFTVSGTLTLQDSPDAGSINGAGSTVSIWQEDKPPRLLVVGQDGTYSFGGLAQGTWQMGAAKEGYLSITTDLFELDSAKTQDFVLEKDPDYQWGPGATDGELGCQCSSSHSPSLLLLVIFLLALYKTRWS